MKTILKPVLLTAALWFGATTLATAQDFTVSQTGDRISLPIATDEDGEPAPAPRAKEAIDGVVAMAVRSGQPIQMINPEAPKKFGKGYEMVSRNPAAPRANPDGIILLGFNF